MTIQEFKKRFCCRISIVDSHNGEFIVITEAVRRSDNVVIDRVKSTINIQKTNSWIADSNTPISVTPWNWDKVADATKRGHLDYFAQQAPIEEWYPLDRTENPDISDLYC